MFDEPQGKDRSRELCERALRACANGLPLRHLRSCAVVTDEGRVRLTARERQERSGPYPLHVRGTECAWIDDFSYEGDALLVGARGAVSTRAGALLVVRATGRFSVSELFHVVVPDEGDAAYLEAILSAIDARRLVKGTNAARIVELADLRGAVVPWPEAATRALLVEALEACERGGEEERRLARQVMAAWMEAARRIERLSSAPALPEPGVLEGSPDHADDALAVADGLLSVLGASQVDLLDVVAATASLEDPAIVRKARVCVCFPPSNQGAWTDRAVDEEDLRWTLGVPPRSKANYAWVEQTIACMEDGGSAVLLLGNAALHASIGREADLRRALARSGLVDAVISLPGGLFADGRPPASLLVLDTSARSRGTLFVDALERGASEGTLPSGRNARSLPLETIERVVESFGAWRDGRHRDVPGFCRAVGSRQMAEHDDLLTPWTYLR